MPMKRRLFGEGHGSGEGRGNSPGEVHDTALKAAETDATKRALATFGKPFGLELYRKDKNTSPRPLASKATVESPPVQPRFGSHPDDTTPIPRPSHYYGRRHQGSMTELLRRDQAHAREDNTVGPPSPPAPSNLLSGKIDKSQLVFGEPKRLRDKAHLKFVASQPCLICGRQPSDPHHLRFAQPRAIASRSVMSSPCPCAAAIIDSCTRPAMRSRGGKAEGQCPGNCERPLGENPRRNRQAPLEQRPL